FHGNKLADFKSIVSSIARIHPDAGVIIGFRKHADFVLSSYKQYLHEGGAISQREFFDVDGGGLLRHEDICFKSYISFLSERFSNLFVYTIDDVKSFDKFNERFSAFIGVEKNDIELKKGEVNRGVKTHVQVKTLFALNTINAWIRRNFGVNLLYSKLLRYMRITPRQVCQKYLTDIGRDYEIDEDI